MKDSAKMNNLKRRVWVEIDVSRLRANYAKIAAAVKPLKVLCVLKANAYGLGVMPYAAALAETDCAGFGVAEPFEALQLADGKKPVQIPSSIWFSHSGPLLPCPNHPQGLPKWLRGKESACNVGDVGLIPGSGRSPEEGHGNPLQYSCLGNPWIEEPGGL